MKFDCVNKTITLVGKRCSGKSELLKSMCLRYKSNWKKIFVICPTEAINGFYKNLVPPEQVMDTYEEVWVDALIAEMTKINVEKNNATAEHVLLILDDCISDVNFHQSPSLKKLFTRGRHIFISVITTTQHLTGIPPVMRNNSDYILVGQLNRASLTMLCDEFMAGSVEKDQFLALYHKATKGYGFFVINCNSVEDGADIDQIYGVARTPADAFR